MGIVTYFCVSSHCFVVWLAPHMKIFHNIRVLFTHSQVTGDIFFAAGWGGEYPGSGALGVAVTGHGWTERERVWSPAVPLLQTRLVGCLRLEVGLKNQGIVHSMGTGRQEALHQRQSVVRCKQQEAFALTTA
jgi:hypothetical protein